MSEGESLASHSETVLNDESVQEPDDLQNVSDKEERNVNETAHVELRFKQSSSDNSIQHLFTSYRSKDRSDSEENISAQSESKENSEEARTYSEHYERSTYGVSKDFSIEAPIASSFLKFIVIGKGADNNAYQPAEMRSEVEDESTEELMKKWTKKLVSLKKTDSIRRQINNAYQTWVMHGSSYNIGGSSRYDYSSRPLDSVGVARDVYTQQFNSGGASGGNYSSNAGGESRDFYSQQANASEESRSFYSQKAFMGGESRESDFGNGAQRVIQTPQSVVDNESRSFGSQQYNIGGESQGFYCQQSTVGGESRGVYNQQSNLESESQGFYAQQSNVGGESRDMYLQPGVGGVPTYNEFNLSNTSGEVQETYVQRPILKIPSPNDLANYPINVDPNPEVVIKQNTDKVVYNQDIAVRYLQPPTPPPPAPIIIKEVRPKTPPAPPPLVIRVRPPAPRTPSPVIIRERPPKPPTPCPPKVITKLLPPRPPPPRKVIIQHMPPMPPKPRPVIIEKWLPYKHVQRPVIYMRENMNNFGACDVSNRNQICYRDHSVHNECNQYFDRMVGFYPQPVYDECVHQRSKYDDYIAYAKELYKKGRHKYKDLTNRKNKIVYEEYIDYLEDGRENPYIDYSVCYRMDPFYNTRHRFLLDSMFFPNNANFFQGDFFEC